MTTVLYWFIGRTYPRPALDVGVARELIRFGIRVTAVTLLAYAIYNVDYMAVGTRLGETDLGLYTLAYRIPELLVLNLCIVVSEVLFSALSSLQHDRESLTRHYLQTLAVVAALTTPIGIMLSMSAAAALQMGVVLLGLAQVTGGLAAPLELVLIIGVGIGVYVVLLRFTAPHLFAAASGTVRRRLSRTAASTTAKEGS